MIRSVWNDTVKLPSFGRLEQDKKTDVLILGGGLAGVLCAYMLEQSGVDYLLIEADRICNGVTGNTTAKITAQHGLIYDKLIREFGPEQARLYWEANEAALGQYRQLSENIACDLETKDSYVYSVDRREKLEQECRALERIGVPAQLVEKVPLPFSVAGAVRIKGQAQFNPLKLAAGLAGGLKICEQTTARSFDGRSIQTDHGRITAKKIVVATHFPIFNKHGGYFLKMYQHRSYVLGLERAPDVDGMYVDERKTGLSFRNYGDLLLLGGGAHRTGRQGGGWEELTRFARDHFPEAREKYRWAAQDCMTLDGMAYIGRYAKGTADLYVATGFNKWGITTSMVAACVLCDLVQGKENRYAALFSPSRTMLRPQLAANAFSATVGLLTPTTRRCPHMGCALKWNPQEHSWDCSCHGSRFTEEGKLLDNPATGDWKHD